ncbi:MAG: Fe-S cluster assembly ATP-binding protein [Mariniblastus sp.]|jgi:Fe-S cluster assembly ATP-binding protein
MLEIKNLHARCEETEILKGINLHVATGEVHAIMGPNGSGKSTLAHVIAGHEDYEVTAGEILYNGKNLLDLEIEERAAEGVFMAYQYPVEIAGVSNKYFLKAAMNSIRKYHGEEVLSRGAFVAELKENLEKLGMEKSMMDRSVNEGFSGGEKKRNEILQMAMMKPKLAVLDETDSGLDIDALKIVADGVNALRSPERSTIIVTHYQRLLDYIVPDKVHVLAGGKIVRSGDKSLALELEDKGYGFLKEMAAS